MDQQLDEYKRSFDGLAEKIKKGFLPGANGGLKSLMLFLFAHVLYRAGTDLVVDLRFASFLVSNFGSYDEGGTGESLTMLAHAFLQVLFPLLFIVGVVLMALRKKAGWVLVSFSFWIKYSGN